MKNANISLLQTLGDTLCDSIKGYEQGAEKAESETLIDYLRGRANERKGILGSVNREIERLGGEAVTSGSFIGAAHRMLLDLSDVIGTSNRAVVARVEEGESYLRDKFETALERGDLDASSRTTVETALKQIRESAAIATAMDMDA